MHVFGKNNGLNAKRVMTLGKFVKLAGLHDLQIAKASATMYFVKAINGQTFISALELRPLGNDIFVTQSGSLALLTRWDTSATTNQTIR